MQRKGSYGEVLGRSRYQEETTSKDSDMEEEKEVNKVDRDQVWPRTSVRGRTERDHDIAVANSEGEGTGRGVLNGAMTSLWSTPRARARGVLNEAMTLTCSTPRARARGVLNKARTSSWASIWRAAGGGPRVTPAAARAAAAGQPA